MSEKPVAWLMTYPGCDGSADWVEIGANEPEPEDGAEAHALVRMSEVETAKAAERERIAVWLEGQGQPGYAHQIRFLD